MTAKATEASGGVGDGSAPSLNVNLAELRSLLHDTVAEATAPLQEQLTTLKQRLDATEKLTPKFVATKAERPGGDYRQTLADMMANEQRDGTKGRVPVLANGKPLPNGIFALMHPSFENGDRVQLKLDAVRVPATNGKSAKTWGDICQSVGCEGTGYVVKKLDQLTQFGWLYHVHIDGIHAGDRFQGITEDQLLAAS